MKRTWAYIGALLPLASGAMAHAAKGGHVKPPDDATSMDDASPEKAGNKEKKPGEDTGEGALPENHAPAGPQTSATTTSDPAAGPATHDSGAGGLGPPLNAHVTGPADASNTGVPSGTVQHSGPVGGGSATVVTQKVGQEGEPPENAQSPSETSGASALDGPAGDQYLPGGVGLAEADPSDADAMMIILGGSAVGTGEGATTEGDVQFEIVDYGPLTIGTGYATYQSSGGEAALADSFAEVVGADQVFIFSNDFMVGNPGLDGTNIAHSTTYVIAIDYEEDAFGAGDCGWCQPAGHNPFAAWGGDSEQDVTTDGNAALLSFVSDVQQDENLGTVDAGTMVVDTVGSGLSVTAQTEQGQLTMFADAQGVETLTSGTGSITEVGDEFSSISGTISVIG